MRGSYNSYSSDVRAAIVKAGNPHLFPELKIPESTARYWIKASKIARQALPISNSDLDTLQRTVLDLELVLKCLAQSSVSVANLSANELVRMKIALKSKQLTKLIPRKISNLLKEAVFRCPIAVDGICIHRYPTRLDQEEVRKMREYYQSELFGHMSVCSLALKAYRDGIVRANLTTWYRYARKLGWNRPLQKRAVRKYRNVGIKATRPNQVWHVDVTEIPSDDGDKLFLSVVLDNFSRTVLSWRLSEKKSQEISEEILQEALKTSGRKKASVLEIVSDGGAENLVFKKITDGVLIQHKIAGKEIKQPNTMIEAFFKSMKSDNLSRIELADKDAVREAVSFYIDRHNHEIPRKSLKGRTPLEALSGKEEVGIIVPRAAIILRIETNQTVHCPVCLV